MGAIDEATQKLVVRIVYDGAVRAGKTTNLRGLCRSLTPLRRSELFVPEEVAGRTLFFDWLQIEGGVVGGRPLRCQFVTVPGQAVLHRRRRFLLGGADAVVFVCDSTAKGAATGRELLRSLRGFFGAFGLDEPPIVLQANKQDLPGALDPDSLRMALDLDEAVPVVAASAESGTGIRETAVLAIRAAAGRLEKQLLERGTEPFTTQVVTAEELHRSMIELENESPLSPLQTLRMAGTADPVADADADAGADSEEPTLPDPSTPSGTLWPTPEGRDVLRELSGKGLRLRSDLVAQPGAGEGSGRSDAFIYEAGSWCLKTSRRRRYSDPALARRALVDLVRAKLELGAMMPRRTVLCLGTDSTGFHWLWTIAPWLKTLRAEMAEADRLSQEAALGRALADFADVAVACVVLAARGRLVLDVHPSNFAREGDGIVYLDDDIGRADVIPAIGYNLLQRVEEYAHRPGAIETYLTRLEHGVSARLSREDAERVELEAAIEQAVVRSDEARRAQRRLKGIVSRQAVAGRGA